VEGDYARFYAEPKEEEDKGNRGYQWVGAYRHHVKGARLEVNEQESEEQKQCAQMSHDEVVDACFLGFWLLKLRHNKQERGERHYLPEEEEREHAKRGDNQKHRKDKDIHECNSQVFSAVMLAMLNIVERVNGDGG